MVLHCRANDDLSPTSGVSTLVDTFAVASFMKENHPEEVCCFFSFRFSHSPNFRLKLV